MENGSVPHLAHIPELQRLDSAMIANAVETFGVGLPNTGFYRFQDSSHSRFSAYGRL